MLYIAGWLNVSLWLLAEGSLGCFHQLRCLQIPAMLHAHRGVTYQLCAGGKFARRFARMQEAT